MIVECVELKLNSARRCCKRNRPAGNQAMAFRSRALLFLQLLTSLCSYSLCDRPDESAYDHIETRGNSTLGCSSLGLCTPCSYSEKGNDESYHCSFTGYRQAYSCVELGSDDKLEYQQMDSKRGLYKSVGALQDWAGRKVATREDSTMHDGHEILYIYSSCIPTKKDEELSVLAFEGIVLVLLAVSAPVVYHRRRRHFSVSGMSRLPTTSVRF